MNTFCNCPMCEANRRVAAREGLGGILPIPPLPQAYTASLPPTPVGTRVFKRPTGYDKYTPIRGIIVAGAMACYYTVEPANSRGTVELWNVEDCYLNENDAKKAMADSYLAEAKRIADRAYSIIQSYKR